ncbi:lipoprotein 17-related variable surface protein [Treponema denticola]|uniref:lipoprotein 17-related variable surface protein n=1 Tax=Treponema denticola TaxID=158 RepID=UPI002105F6D3|nr:lipoprotein 17-related variable surface protein [Treponema denticola]
MKHINKSILSAVLLFVVLLTIGCPQTGKLSGTKNQGIAPAVPQNPYELTEADVFEAFGLTKGTQSPFEAAEKIASGNSALSSIVFTEKNVTAYDDEAGTFTVKVKGTKNGKEFEKEMNFSGFTNPYDSQPRIIDSAGSKGQLKLDEGIEHNYSIEKYITEAYPAIADFFKEPLAFSFENGTSVTLGDFDYYKLEATLAKEGTDKIKIQPVYTVKNHKKVSGGSDTVTTTKYTNFTRFNADLTKNYFTEEDVFKYVAEKVKDDIIKVPANTFASYIYARAKYLNATPGDLFNDGEGSKLKKYQDIYKKSDGYIKIIDIHGDSDLSYAVYNPKDGGIQADDYSGTIKVKYYIQRNGVIASVKEGTYPHAIEPVSVEKNGFMRVSEDFLKNNFLFNLIKSATDKEAAKTKWLGKSINNVELLGEKNPEGFARKNEHLIDYYHHNVNDYYLSVNNTTTLADLAVESKQYISIAKGIGTEYGLLITSIRMNKKKNEKELVLEFSFVGTGDPIKLTINPSPWN